MCFGVVITVRSLPLPTSALDSLAKAKCGWKVIKRYGAKKKFPTNSPPSSTELLPVASVYAMDEYRYCLVTLLTGLIPFCLSLFAEVSKHTAVLKMKALTAVRPATVAVIFDTSHISKLRQEPCRPFFISLSDNGTTSLQKYLTKVN
jgi:hypothetical protein